MAKNATIAEILSAKVKLRKVAFFRQKFPEIQEALAAGARSKDVIQVLKKQGLEISPSLFNKYLHAERQKLSSSTKSHALDAQDSTKTNHSIENNIFEPTNNEHQKSDRKKAPPKINEGIEATKSNTQKISQSIPKLPNGQPDIDWMAQQYLKSKGKA